ncbi:MAG: hypothetical protein V8Q75_06365 [Bacilli bacterium]
MKTARTLKLEELLEKKFNDRNEFYVFECTLGWYGSEIVDCVMYNCQREVYCYEIKQSKQDFHSNCKLSFFGNKNYFVMPYELYKEVSNEIYVNYPNVGVLVPIKTPSPGEQEYVYDVYDQLLCIKNARKQDLMADKEVILSSMLRSMQRDKYRKFRGDKCY